ncbi:urea transporter [Hufsiella ginkgonis]|uniref:Peptidoglycan DD-metalloendopeptidase family protein n=1 Tax=Hufsiella ginkgonis TaxID=2695274 RepID=A0A7K1Y2K7_9SPHI|nr:urea transporter [Hufsiella ginkgonis]MXV16916.1 peptidoglycan DD-metalloendopeptidase family protein [Hufsiella ginkgonis]
MKKHAEYYLQATLNSYAIVFFSQNKTLAAIMLVVSFFNFHAGISALLAVVASLVMVTVSGFSKETAKTGLYTFNSMLLGIGFGTFFNFNQAYWIWLATALLTCIFLSVTLISLLGKYNLPVLSIPFILTFWLVLTGANSPINLGLGQQTSSLLFEWLTGGLGPITGLSSYLNGSGLPGYIGLFFRSVSSVLFQNNILAGILLSIGLLIHSRIGFSLLVTGFITSCLFNHYLRMYPDGISNYHLGANFMMVAASIGGFFLVPSWRSYIWAVFTVPVSFLMVSALGNILGAFDLPVFSMPFCIVTLGLLYFFLLRVHAVKLQLTPYQFYSPEKNLYQFLNVRERLQDLQYVKLTLPFMGSWAVSQGYDGGITHKGDWGKALDFVIRDADGKTYRSGGTLPEHFYCYNKPVLACADGTIEEVISYIDDNAIGHVNMVQNWGNTIIIRHAHGLYTKISHLKKNSAKVKPGDFVKRGDLLALCGNSGRSPEPHLHFQVQATPYIGAKTLEYPLAAFTRNGSYVNFGIPAEGDLLQPPELNYQVKKAFDFKPGYVATVSSAGTTETWEVFTDAYNHTYFFSKETNAVAYFINNDTKFYFTNFYGDKDSLLYLFYLSAYSINFSDHPATDFYPLNLGINRAVLWLQDIVSPFYSFIKLNYHSHAESGANGPTINTTAVSVVGSHNQAFLAAQIGIEDNRLAVVGITFKNRSIQLQWQSKELF